MEVQHEAGHYLKVKYNWIHVVPGEDGNKITFPFIDTGYFRDWNLVQIEGEDPIVAEEIDPKIKFNASFKKQPTVVKGGGHAKLEEISDNRARIINYERNGTGEEGVGLDITEEIAFKFTEAVLNLEIYEANI